MVLVSRMADAIPYTCRVLGEDAVQGMYVQTSANTYVHIGSVRESIISAYSRKQITAEEFEHFSRILLNVFAGYYFDSRFTLPSLHDPFIRMNIIIWLEEHGDTFPHHPEDRLVDDLQALEELDTQLWRDLNGNEREEGYLDEDWRAEIQEVIDLTYSDTDEETGWFGEWFERQDFRPFDQDSIETISLFSDIENVDPGWDIREAFEPPTGFGPDGL